MYVSMTEEDVSTTPMAIMIIALLNIAVGLFGIVTGVYALVISQDILQSLIDTLRFGSLFIGSINVIAGIGLLRLENWAWYLTSIVTIFGLANNLIVVLVDWTFLDQYFLPILIRVLILSYLFQDEVANKFK